MKTVKFLALSLLIWVINVGSNRLEICHSWVITVTSPLHFSAVQLHNLVVFAVMPAISDLDVNDNKILKQMRVGTIFKSSQIPKMWESWGKYWLTLGVKSGNTTILAGSLDAEFSCSEQWLFVVFSAILRHGGSMTTHHLCLWDECLDPICLGVLSTAYSA